MPRRCRLVRIAIKRKVTTCERVQRYSLLVNNLWPIFAKTNLFNTFTLKSICRKRRIEHEIPRHMNMKKIVMIIFKTVVSTRLKMMLKIIFKIVVSTRLKRTTCFERGIE
jgi:hypothetical protein